MDNLSTTDPNKPQIIKGMVILFLFVIYRSIITFYWGEYLGTVTIEYVLILLISFLVCSVGLIYLGFTKWIKIELKRWWNAPKKKSSIKWGILGVIIILFLNLIIFMFFGFFQLIPPIEASNPDIDIDPENPELILLALFFTISLQLILGVFFGFFIAAYIEEILFRGFLFDVLGKKLKPMQANLAQAFLFSICHIGYIPLTSWYLFIMLFVSGLVLGLLRIKTGNILAPYIAHGIIG